MAAAKKQKVSLESRGISSNWINFIRTKKQNPKFKIKPSQELYKPAIKTRRHSKVMSLDCEMISDDNGESMLARVSIVDFNLNCVFDKFVKPSGVVGDYRTRFSGIRPDDLENGDDFDKVQKEVRQLLFNKILVGHGLSNDLKVLKFRHHLKLIRDTSLYAPFREISNGKTPALRKLAHHFLQENIQDGEHNSVQDAAAAMKLYKKFRQEWEKSKITLTQHNTSKEITVSSAESSTTTRVKVNLNKQV